MIPIPPNHCNNDLHIKIPSERLCKLFITVDPVVVPASWANQTVDNITIVEGYITNDNQSLFNGYNTSSSIIRYNEPIKSGERIIFDGQVLYDEIMNVYITRIWDQAADCVYFRLMNADNVTDRGFNMAASRWDPQSNLDKSYFHLADSDGGGSDDDGGNDDGGGGDDDGGDDDGGDDNDNDNDNEEKEEEQEQEEEQEEEEQEEEEQEEEEEEESDEEEEESEEEEKEEKKKRNPILISANLMAMSGLDGTLSNIASFGYSQTALNGVDSYSANLMIWDNLKQFTLGGAKSHIIYNYDRPIDFIIREDGKEYKFGTFYGKGSIHSIQSISLSTMYMYGIVNISTGLSNVYIRNGLIAGYSLSNNVLFGNGNYTIMPSASFFGTKPYKVNRFTISPMVALALNPIYFSSIEDKIAYNEHVVGVLGANFDFPLTENFKANIGGNIVKSTDNFPLTYSITIGAKFKLY